MEVFLQILGLTYLSDTNSYKFHDEHEVAWQQVASTKRPPPPPGYEVEFIGLLLLHDGEEHEKYSIVPLHILKMDMEAFRNGTFFSRYSHAEPVLGERVPRPLTTGSLIRFVVLLRSLTLPIL